jgi:hypothetical protein
MMHVFRPRLGTCGAALWLLFAPGAWSTTHRYYGAAYTTVNNYTTCSSGPCANFSTAMNVSGSFTTATALAASLTNANVASQVTSYSFSDGINTYSSANANTRIYRFNVSTNSAGQVSSTSILLELWLTGTSPHSTNDRFSYVSISTASSFGNHNNCCSEVGVSLAGVADACTGVASDASTSSASSMGGEWFSGADVPVLSAWGLLALAALLGGYALARLGRAETV